MVYLDHAATTPMKDGVLEAMLPFFADEYANASAGYAAARKCRRAMDIARHHVAALIGASASEIYFTSGGTESDNWAISSAASAGLERNSIVTSCIEHHAVLHTCESLASQGIACGYIPVDTAGRVDIQAARALMNSHTALVSVMLANNETGVIQPVKELSSIAHDQGALMHTDAVQAVGHIPVHVDELGVDMLSMSAHKFGGPKGIGALYIRKGARMRAFMHGGAQEKGMRPGTENLPAIVGMGQAARLAAVSMEEERLSVSALRDAMLAMIHAHIPHARINGENACCLPGHVHLSIPDRDASVLLARLDMEGIAASSASACASGSLERSHVIRAMYPMDMPHAELRFTVGAGNTIEEIEHTVKLLAQII